ncbi:P-loop containing nucleoside triphosphate hydrolases superfamily protein [Perilla frutescens var. hirtella]|nr:P-loop containing nucleoside triphosphate hydrolases superfamily protein [Perilla frutescens var. hirtella]
MPCYLFREIPSVFVFLVTGIRGSKLFQYHTNGYKGILQHDLRCLEFLLQMSYLEIYNEVSAKLFYSIFDNAPLDVEHKIELLLFFAQAFSVVGLVFAQAFSTVGLVFAQAFYMLKRLVDN